MRPSPLLAALRTGWQGSTCTISRSDPDAEPVWNGAEYVPATVEVYQGRCHLRPMDTQQRVVQAGERPISLRSYLVEIPVDVDVQTDDVVEVDTSPDPQAAGTVLRVLDAPRDELATVRILECELQV